MSIELLERAAAALDDLLPGVVFVGGATIPLWISDPAAPPARLTNDVDVVVKVVTRSEFYKFEAALRVRGFAEDQTDGVICRWRHAGHELILDAMPARGEILGFENPWQAAAIPTAIDRTLPSGATIRVASPPFLIATKLAAFVSRGRGDLLGSRDFQDIVALIDGRPELAGEVDAAPSPVRSFIADGLAALLARRGINDGLAGALPPDAASQDRVDWVIRPVIEHLSSPTRPRQDG